MLRAAIARITAEGAVLRDRRFSLACLGLALAMVVRVGGITFQGARLADKAQVSQLATWDTVSPIVLLFVLILISGRSPRVRLPRFLAIAAATAITIGLVWALVRPAALMPSATIDHRLVWVLLSAGQLMLCVCWVDELASAYAGKPLLLCYGFALLLAQILSLAASSLGGVPKWLVLMAIPSVSVALLLARPRERCGTLPEDAACATSEQRGANGVGFTSNTRLWMIGLTLSLYGIVNGVTKSTWTRGLAETAPWVAPVIKPLLLMGSVLGALIIIVGIMLFSGGGFLQRRLLLLPLLMVPLYLSTFIGGTWVVVYAIPNIATSELVVFLVWVALASPHLRRRYSAVYIYSVGSFFYFSFNAVASWIGTVPTLATDIARGVTASAAIVLLVGLEFRWHSASSADASSPAVASRDFIPQEQSLPLVCVAERYNLTSRECDILMLLARGRTASHIAATYTIAQSTAKTHIRRIYQKTGVHSQQELIDLVESETELTR